MKKDRNCGNGFPVYPNYIPNMMPGVPNMGMMPYGMDMNYSQGGDYSQMFSKLNSQISSLERRVSNLENLVGSNSNTYNNSNYQML